MLKRGKEMVMEFIQLQGEKNFFFFFLSIFFFYSAFFSRGDIYVGYYVDDIRQGSGIYTMADGSRYEGKNFFFFFSVNFFFLGNFYNGVPNGNGIYVFQNGEVYT